MDFSQEYISHEYIELKMAPGRDAQGRPVFAMDPNHLHIWPRHTFMLIALPNQVRTEFTSFRNSISLTGVVFIFDEQDQSFTCTLFAPSLDFDQLREPRAFTTWFREQFEDAFHLIGEENLVKSVLDNPRCSLICTKVGSLLGYSASGAKLIYIIVVEAIPLQGPSHPSRRLGPLHGPLLRPGDELWVRRRTHLRCASEARTSGSHRSHLTADADYPTESWGRHR